MERWWTINFKIITKQNEVEESESARGLVATWISPSFLRIIFTKKRGNYLSYVWLFK